MAQPEPVLSPEMVAFYHEHGYLRIPAVYTPAETDELSNELDRLVSEWACKNPGWSGPWRQAYMTPEVEQRSKLIAMHDLQFYSAAWCRAVTHPRLAAALTQLLGPNVELHHSTMHIKPPNTGHPFPMHQDYAFYQHANGNYVDAIVHLDDTCHENGELRFLAGSHKAGALEHVCQNADGTRCTPHLPTAEWPLEDTVPAPAKRGDVVVFHIHCVHGSYINTTGAARRLVRVGYRDPENQQVAGQALGRPGLMVAGTRPRAPGQELFPHTTHREGGWHDPDLSRAAHAQ